MSKLFLDQSSEEINLHKTDLGKKQQPVSFLDQSRVETVSFLDQSRVETVSFLDQSHVELFPSEISLMCIYFFTRLI